jgi:hypothetical protein
MSCLSSHIARNLQKPLDAPFSSKPPMFAELAVHQILMNFDVLCREPAYIAYQVIGAAVCIAASISYFGTATSASRLSKRFPFIIPMRPVLLAVASSIPGTQALLHSKCLATMFVVTLGQANQMRHWFFWVAAVVQAAAAALWTAALTHGMNVFPTVIVLPVLQVCPSLLNSHESFRLCTCILDSHLEGDS